MTPSEIYTATKAHVLEELRAQTPDTLFWDLVLDFKVPIEEARRRLKAKYPEWYL